MASNSAAGISLDAATDGDITFISALAADPAVEPFLMPGAGDEHGLRELVAGGGAANEGLNGLFVIRSHEGERLGGLALRVVYPRSRVCELSRLMVTPDRRRGGVAAQAVSLACREVFVTHRLHRIQAEVYGDNVGGQAFFESIGFVREGARRQAYWRRDRWLDGVLFGLLADEFERAS